MYEDMVDSIRFTGERYSVKLPWKTGNYHLPDNYRLSQSRMQSQLWWNGPSWLVKEESFWPKQEPISDTEETEEERAISMVASNITEEDGLGSIMDVTRYGTLWKLFRITA